MVPYIDLGAGMRVQRVARFSPKANFILWKVESGCEDTEWTLAGQDPPNVQHWLPFGFLSYSGNVNI